jgi:type II secretory ATPase GspE/PulE/Tfp pilus assembly ATPase PilB-like protein/tetratricopeptide (TPR) repeat protein
MDIATKVKEADAYHRQGLFVEALTLYENLLADAQDIPTEIRQQVDTQMAALQAKIEEVNQQDPSLNAEHVSLLRETWISDENPSEIISSARAFRELGLYREAADEYVKLLASDFDLDSIVPDLAECFSQLHGPSRIINQVEKLTSEVGLENDRNAAIKFGFGLQMAQLGHEDLALEFFEAVRELSPDFPGLDKRIGLLRQADAYTSRYDYLLQEKLVTTSQLQNALAMAKKSGKSVEFILMEQMRVDRDAIGKSLSLFYGKPFKTVDPDLQAPYELLSKLKKTFLLKNAWVPLSWELSGVDVLVDDPSDLLKTDTIPSLIGSRKINYFVGIREDIESMIKMFYEDKPSSSDIEESEGDEDFELMPEIDFEEDDEDDDAGYEDVNEASGQIVRLVDQILISAYRKETSDIHIEPSVVTKKTMIRFRIDGVCQEMLQLPNANARAIMSRLKIMSGLDIAERRLPQDGKIKFKRKGIKPFELRLATLPTAGGFEDAVLRILAESGAMSLDDMGLNDRNLGIMKKILKQPYGLVLVVGPTGSGKTTTLHAALGYINKPGIKIWTAEDPVEITQLGLRQVECKPKIGLDFARVMRAFLRADPDVIMIGEMRDKETASIGVEASLTGHLVLSTLHTNSAPETITRLLDMGLNPLNFSDAFLGVLAQRLIRRLCKKCITPYTPNQEEFDDIVRDYGEEDFASLGIGLGPELTINRAEGCEACDNTGYKGRAGVHELMEGTKTVKKLIKNEAPTEELFALSASEGMKTIKQDGILKVFAGLTDMPEIRRVCVS